MAKKKKQDLLIEIKEEIKKNTGKTRQEEIKLSLEPDPLLEKSAGANAAVVELTVRLIDWIIPVLNNFPRSQRFLLSDKIEMLLLEVLDRLIRAVYAKRNKVSHLWDANVNLQIVRSLLRLALMRKYITHKRYFYAVTQLIEIGKMTGGWINSLDKKSTVKR